MFAAQLREEYMGLEKMPSGRRMETGSEDEVCPDCRGKGTTGNSPENIRMCRRCDGKGKIRKP
jgi:DnaJ-class molecular chaperone